MKILFTPYKFIPYKFTPYKFPKPSDYMDFFYVLPEPDRYIQEHLMELEEDHHHKVLDMQNRFQEQLADEQKWFNQERQILLRTKQKTP